MPRPLGAPPLTQAMSSLTTTSANSWLLSILCFVRTNISIIFCDTFSALVLVLEETNPVGGPRLEPEAFRDEDEAREPPEPQDGSLA